MRIGMIGLGRMGANMVRRLHRRADTSAWLTTARPQARARRSSAYGAQAAALARGAGRGRCRRRARSGSWCRPAIVDSVIAQLRRCSPPGDILIDGGNSQLPRRHPPRRRARERRASTTSTSARAAACWASSDGYCLMIGGDAQAVSAAGADAGDARPGRHACRRAARARPQARGGGAGLPALRRRRRRPFREDGPQRHRVRADGGLRGRPEHPGARGRGPAQRRRRMPRPRRSPTRASSSTSSTSPRSPKCGATAASSPRGCWISTAAALAQDRQACRFRGPRRPIPARAAGRSRPRSRWVCRRTC